MTGGLTHVEIFGAEPEELAAFYRELFGWRIEQVPGVDYWRIQADPAGSASAVGGLARRPPFELRGWLPYVQVASLEAAMATAERRGATVLKPRTAVPRTAWYAVLTDPAGNAFAIWQPDATAFPPPLPD